MWITDKNKFVKKAFIDCALKPSADSDIKSEKDGYTFQGFDGYKEVKIPFCPCHGRKTSFGTPNSPGDVYIP